MIFGFVKIENGAVVTHRDSYRIENLSVVSVRRPYLAGATLLSVGALGFTLAFGDLMRSEEIAIAITGSLVALMAGIQIGQLSLLSRDLRGSELSSAVWGQHKPLQEIRSEIMRAIWSLEIGEDHA